MPEFDTIFGAMNSYLSDHTIKELYYDDLKRKIVTRRPNNSNNFKLIDKTMPIGQDTTDDIVIKIATWHVQQYADDLTYEAEREPISYDELFDLLNTQFKIFYDAARVIQSWIFNSPEKFGLQKIMHHEKSLAFTIASPCLTV